MTALVVGGVLLAVFAIGNDLGDGARAFGVMALVAMVFALGGRHSEAIADLNEPDERSRTMNLRAMGFSGLVIIVGVVGGWLYEIARGDDGSPYGQLALAGAVAYLLSLGYHRSRH